MNTNFILHNMQYSLIEVEYYDDMTKYQIDQNEL